MPVNLCPVSLTRAHPCSYSQNALRDTAWAVKDGVIQCSFRRDIDLDRLNQSRFNLNRSYFLFMAHGKAENGETMRVGVSADIEIILNSLGPWHPWESHQHPI